MDDHVAHDELIEYCLGATADDAHARIDEHLCACPPCLRAFLDVKRHVEGRGAAERGGLRPSAATRARLRASVGAAFEPAPVVRLGRALRRPIPLYQGVAAAVLAVALAVLLPMVRGVARPGAPPSAGASGARVDTARTSPESLDIY